jgi:hypothetical protein
MPGYMNPIPGRRFGMGFGRGGGGRGWRNRFYATGLPGWIRCGWYAAPYQNPNPELEKQALKNQADFLQSELEQIKKRLSELETGESAK